MVIDRAAPGIICSQSILSWILITVVFGFSLINIPTTVVADEIPDPFEPVNRVIFSFNDTVDVYFLEPIAQSYDNTLPDNVKLGITNFFDNLSAPLYIASDLIELDFTGALKHTARFIANTTFGVGGFVDAAKTMELPKVSNDIGAAIGSYGVPTGPYLVLPFLGPSNLRDATGKVGEYFLSPQNSVMTDSIYLSAGLRALETIDLRRRLLEATKLGKESSFDYYIFVRSSYSQRRLNLVYQGEAPSGLLGTTEGADYPSDPLDDKQDDEH